jgi:hypothetical protein
MFLIYLDLAAWFAIGFLYREMSDGTWKVGGSVSSPSTVQEGLLDFKEFARVTLCEALPKNTLPMGQQETVEQLVICIHWQNGISHDHYEWTINWRYRSKVGTVSCRLCLVLLFCTKSNFHYWRKPYQAAKTALTTMNIPAAQRAFEVWTSYDKLFLCLSSEWFGEICLIILKSCTI